MENVIKEKPLVSIWCMTYNHAPYIKEAIEGFLMQKTDFPVEIVIHDDASTDGTIDILKEYEKLYPEKFRMIYEEENIYSKENRDALFFEIKKRYLTGKYIAICEGDDCWTSPNKLQMQVDYMEAHEDCVLTAHNAEWIDCQTGRVIIINPEAETGRLSKETIIRISNGMVATASLVMRNEVAFMPKFFRECGIGDVPLQYYSITKGYVYYFNEVMSKYRFLHEGSWSANVQAKPKKYLVHCMKMIIFLIKYNEYTDRKFQRWIKHRTLTYIHAIAQAYKELSEAEYNDIIEAYNKANNYKYEKILQELNYLGVIIANKNFLEEKSLDFYKGCKELVVWGTGEYATECTKQLLEKGIEIKGYLVTEIEDGKTEFYGRRVWSLEEFVKERGNAGVVVAVRTHLWNTIRYACRENNIEKCYYPFDFSIKEKSILCKEVDCCE